MLDEREIIEFIREHPGIFSSEVVAFYKKQGVLADPRNQNKLTAIIRKTCNFFKEDGKTKISLKEGY